MMNALGLPGMAMRPMSVPEMPQVGMVPGVPGSMGLNPRAMSFPPMGAPMSQLGFGHQGQFRNALADWRQQFPSFGFGGPQGFRSMMGGINPGGPIMTPGGGGTGAPMQGGQMSANPMPLTNPMPSGSGQMPTSYQLPNY